MMQTRHVLPAWWVVSSFIHAETLGDNLPIISIGLQGADGKGKSKFNEWSVEGSVSCRSWCNYPTANVHMTLTRKSRFKVPRPTMCRF